MTHLWQVDLRQDSDVQRRRGLPGRIVRVAARIVHVLAVGPLRAPRLRARHGRDGAGVTGCGRVASYSTMGC